MKIGVIGVMLLCCIALSLSASAFDGNRKGFVLGGGVGFTPNVDNSGKGLAGDFLIGYTLGNRNSIVWEINGMWGKYTHINEDVLRFYSGSVWHHYFGDEHPSFYSAIGYGRYGTFRIDRDGKFRTLLFPRGYIVGGGYEFNKHIRAGLYLSGTWNWEGYFERIGIGRYHISFLVTAVAY